MTEKMENTAVESEEIKEAAVETKDKKKKKSRKRKILKRIIWMLVILLVIAIAGWSVYSRLMAEYKITYDPYTAITGSISNSLSFTGSMQLIDSATYTASSASKVREVYVSVGDKVKDGDKLMRLNGGETIEAEFDGTVSSINVAKGDEVAAGDSLITVADFDHMTVSVRVGESNIAQVSVGQSCKITVSSVGASFESVIETIDYASYSGNNVAYYTATVNVDTSEAENVWPGMQATVTIPLEEAQNVTVLKMDALSTARNNTAYVYKENENGEMEEVTVTVGVSNGNYVEIKEGVTAGETVYKIAEKEEEATGLAALFSGLFTNRQVNRPNRNRNSQGGGSTDFDFGSMDFSNMPSGGSFPGGSFPGGSGGNSGGSSSGGFPGGGSRGN